MGLLQESLKSKLGLTKTRINVSVGEIQNAVDLIKTDQETLQNAKNEAKESRRPVRFEIGGSIYEANETGYDTHVKPVEK